MHVYAQLLPMLASALEFGGAPSVALGALLQIGKTLDEESFTAQVCLTMPLTLIASVKALAAALALSFVSFSMKLTMTGFEGAACVGQVVPALSKLFASNDRTIRRSLLESIDTYGQHFSQVRQQRCSLHLLRANGGALGATKVLDPTGVSGLWRPMTWGTHLLAQATVEAQVYPHVATGFGDSNAYLRELTLKSMLVLAPKLSQKTLNQSLLKFLAKLQVWFSSTDTAGLFLSLPPLLLS